MPRKTYSFGVRLNVLFIHLGLLRLYGASVLAALDSRNATAKSRGTGGLLQSASYTAGLSGGSWLLTSFVMNDMPQIYDMVLGWNLEKDLFTPTLDPTLQAGFVSSVVADVRDKFNAGFAVTMSDYWVRILSHHFLPGQCIRITRDSFVQLLKVMSNCRYNF